VAQAAGDSARLFFALWPDADVRTALSVVQEQVQGRRMHHADLHLTLIFLGQQPAALLPVLKDVLAHLPCSDIVLTLDRAGYFARNRIAWAGSSSAPPALLDLLAALKGELRRHEVSYREESRGFQPHITLARDAQAPGDVVFDPIRWRACELVLVESQGGNGARYRVLARRRLDEEVRVPDPREDALLGGGN